MVRPPSTGEGSRLSSDKILKRRATACIHDERLSAEAVLGVVVVLDDPRPRGLGPRKQIVTPSEAHGHAERKLVRGRHVGRAGGGGGATSGGNLQTFGVDRYGHDARTGIAKGRHGPVIAGILDPDRIAWTRGRACDEAERLLRAGNDDHLLGAAQDAACFCEISGNGLSERPIATELTVLEQLPAHALPAPRREPRPDADGECFDCRFIRTKRSNDGPGVVARLNRVT
jgi:hypothetical protein